MTKETGGPAFPYDRAWDFTPGMAIRNHFAGLAMQSYLPRGYAPADTAKFSYAMADAMLQERHKP